MILTKCATRKFADTSFVLVEEPVVVGGHPELDREDHAAEVAARHAHALLREERTHGVHGLEAGNHELDSLEELLRRGNPGFPCDSGLLRKSSQ